MAKVDPFKNIDSLCGNIWCGETRRGGTEGSLPGEEEMFEFTDGTEEKKHMKLVRSCWKHLNLVRS